MNGDFMNILDIFYNEVIKEGSIGRIDCGFIYNVMFSTITENMQYESTRKDLQIPTLQINNTKEFNMLLTTYIEKAYNFYNKDYYDSEHDYIKAILVFLIANMTAEEFQNPNEYIKKRIAFLDNTTEQRLDERFFVGNSSYIGDIEAVITKEPIYEETPYSLKFYGVHSKFPTIRFGIIDNIVYIYAIQNEKDAMIDKKMNRTLYKINDGLDTTNESYDNIRDFENLTGVTASTVVSATLALSFFLRNGYTNIRMPSFLPIRFNAKEITSEKKLQKVINDVNFDEITKQLFEKNIEIQRNISDKFIRTFRRISYHFNNINIDSYPFDIDSYLHLTMNENIDCNNDLLYDLFMCGYHLAKRK